MITAPKMCENPCETCAKKGLPLLLTRYALMPKETGAPVLSGKLKDPDLDKVPLGGHAHYGLRLLRSGYVYVFDEKHSLLDEYFVTHDGFLSKQPKRRLAAAPTVKAEQDSLAPKAVEPIALTPSFAETMQLGASKPAPELRCARNGAAPMAGLITVSASANAIWIAFSNVEWTSAVIVKHMDAAFRAKHMRKITVSGGKVLSQGGCEPIDEIKTHVTEYKMEQETAKKAFAKWCPHQYNGRQFAAEKLLKAIKSDRPEGGAAIVALHDPTGLVMEITGLMELRKKSFFTLESNSKPRFAASAILSLKDSIQQQARIDLVKNRTIRHEGMLVQAQAGPGGRHSASYASLKNAGPLMPTAVELQKSADEKWKPYTHKRTGEARFDQKQSQAWLDVNNALLKKHDAEQISPLAKAKVAWVQHRCMVSHMSCNFDDTDLGSGVAYTATVATMFRLTSDKQPSYDLYLKWLKEGDTSASSNLVMRALGFNQTKLLDEIKKIDAKPLDGRAFPTDMLVAYAANALEKLPPGGHAAMADLLQSVGGAMLKNLDAAQQGGPAARALAAVAAVSGVQFTTVEVKGNRGKFVQHMMRTIMDIDPNMRVNHNQMAHALRAQMQLLEIDGLPMDGTDKRKWLTVLDRSSVSEKIASGKTGDALAQELAKSLHSVDDLPKLKAEAFKTGVKGATFAAGSSFVGGLVQSYNFVKLVGDCTSATKGEKNEALARMGAGAMAILGSFGEATGATLEKVHQIRLRNAPGLGAAIVPEYLRATGRLLGLGAGLLVAGLDLMKAWEVNNAGDTGLSRAYMASAALGIGLSVAFYYAASLGPVAWLVVGFVVLAFIGVTWIIEKASDNALQKWLMRCHFGTDGDKYQTSDEAIEQFQAAFS